MIIYPKFWISQVKKIFADRAAEKKKKQTEEFVAYIQSLGLSIVKLKTIGTTQYIEAADGSWRKVGGKTEDPDVKALLNAISHKIQSVKNAGVK